MSKLVLLKSSFVLDVKFVPYKSTKTLPNVYIGNDAWPLGVRDVGYILRTSAPRQKVPDPTWLYVVEENRWRLNVKNFGTY